MRNVTLKSRAIEPASAVQWDPGRTKSLRRWLRKLEPYYWVAPACCVLFIFTHLPILLEGALSLLAADGFSPPRFIGLNNYLEVLSNLDFWEAIVHNIIYAITTVAGKVALSLLVAVLLNQKLLGRNTFRTIAATASYGLSQFRFRGGRLIYLSFILLLTIPVQIYIIPLYIIVVKLRLADNYLGLILPYTAGSLPLAVFLFRVKRYDPGNRIVRQTVREWKQNRSKGKLLLARNHGFCGNWLAGLDTSRMIQSKEPLKLISSDALLPKWLPSKHRETYVAYLQQYTHNVNLLRFILG